MANCTITGEGCGGFSHVTGTEVIELLQGAPSQLTVTCQEAGSPLDLTQYLGSSASSSSSAAEELVVRLGVKVQFWDQELAIDKTGTVTDAAQGVVEFLLTAADLELSGIYDAQVTLHHDDSLVYAGNYYLHIRKNIRYAGGQPAGQRMPSIAEVRLHLLDVCAEQNFLLDDVEFNVEQVVYALRHPLDEFNEMLPPLGREYTPLSFRWKAHWTKAAVAYLLRFASYNLNRNRLQYQGGGRVVDDKSRAEIYLQLSQQLLTEWREWVLHKKIHLNVAAGYGGLRSEYS